MLKVTWIMLNVSSVTKKDIWLDIAQMGVTLVLLDALSFAGTVKRGDM